MTTSKKPSVEETKARLDAWFKANKPKFPKGALNQDACSAMAVMGGIFGVDFGKSTKVVHNFLAEQWTLTRDVQHESAELRKALAWVLADLEEYHSEYNLSYSLAGTSHGEVVGEAKHDSSKKMVEEFRVLFKIPRPAPPMPTAEDVAEIKVVEEGTNYDK